MFNSTSSYHLICYILLKFKFHHNLIMAYETEDQYNARTLMSVREQCEQILNYEKSTLPCYAISYDKITAIIKNESMLLYMLSFRLNFILCINMLVVLLVMLVFFLSYLPVLYVHNYIMYI